MSNLSKFYEVLNTVELSLEDYKIISGAACELANAEMKKGNKIATDIFNK